MVSFLSIVTISYAEDVADIKAQDVKIYTPVYQPAFSEFQPPLGTYTYKVSWQGISAATVKVVVEKYDNKYRITTNAKTFSGIDLFYKLRYSAEGIISAVDLTPIQTTIDHRENSRHKITKISFEKDGGIHATRYRSGSQTEELSFKSNNFTLDPISAAFLARGIEWQVGDSKKFDTFNGKSRYLITLTAARKVTLKINDQEREAWEINPVVENLTSPTANKKLKSASIFLSTDKSREILKIVSSVFIGSVSTTLTAFDPNPAAESTELAMKFLSAKRARQKNS
ncbi:MAG: DUF3108 domain-containing protein [bacterium]|nr:DUF3108 domain-containing protein [bacterium]